MRREIEEALTAWRDADRRLKNAINGDGENLKADVERHRSTFQRLSAEHMMERMDALKEAEQRRRSSVPSTPPFHQAAKDEMSIAADIWAEARMSDEDTPQREQ